MKVSATPFNFSVVTPGATHLPTSASVRDTSSPLIRSSSISSSVFGLTIFDAVISFQRTYMPDRPVRRPVFINPS